MGGTRRVHFARLASTSPAQGSHGSRLSAFRNTAKLTEQLSRTLPRLPERQIRFKSFKLLINCVSETISRKVEHSFQGAS